MDRPLRLIVSHPVEELARTLEALLVVASAPLTSEELAEATARTADRVAAALELLAERYREGRSGIVLEHVAGGFAFRASREAAAACARLFERPVERGLSQAALETLAIVAYLGPCTRPEIARIRGVNVDGVVAGCVERGLLAEAGRDRDARRRPLPHDAAVRARLRARVARRAAAARRRSAPTPPRSASGSKRSPRSDPPEPRRLGAATPSAPLAVPRGGSLVHRQVDR